MAHQQGSGRAGGKNFFFQVLFEFVACDCRAEKTRYNLSVYVRKNFVSLEVFFVHTSERGLAHQTRRNV